jgi:hypothetical protein
MVAVHVRRVDVEANNDGSAALSERTPVSGARSLP